MNRLEAEKRGRRGEVIARGSYACKAGGLLPNGSKPLVVKSTNCTARQDVRLCRGQGAQ